MDAMLKHMEVRDDGFLEVVLKRTKDFDEYIFQQIHKDERCLLCVRDPRSKTRLYYDTKGYLTLKEYASVCGKRAVAVSAVCTRGYGAGKCRKAGIHAAGACISQL